MTNRNLIIEFLKARGGEATLDEISKSVRMPKYGPNSVYAILRTLRSNGIVDRKGEKWALTSKGFEVIETSRMIQSMEDKSKESEAPPQPQSVSSLSVEQIVEVMTKTLRETMMGLRRPSDEWELATKPMETDIEEKKEDLSSFVVKPDIAEEAEKPLKALPTGTFLDDLFYTPEGSPLRGIPICSQFAITGLPGAGKSVLVEEIALKVAASGHKVLFVTAEDTWKSPTPRFDLQARMKQKAAYLGLDWEIIRRNLFVLDTVFYLELRDWNTFAETYRYVVEKEGIDLAIIDSVTILEAYRGALKYRVMELARYNQVKGVTSLFVNQRSAETWDSHEMAGGIGLAHNLDGTIIIDYGRVYWLDQQMDLDLKRGEFVRIARVLDCRLCNFEKRRIRIEITPEGFVRPVESRKSG
ncbi:TPA: hypothetical protein EYP70_04735 [Candidatus Bathyarchaeota archaeon]|nr:hypothetical protein [Candidatus Bathyarchaeota archaeon]